MRRTVGFFCAFLSFGCSSDPAASGPSSAIDAAAPDAETTVDASTADAQTQPSPDGTVQVDAGVEPSDALVESSIGCAAHSDAILCEDFESGAIDPAIWTQAIKGNAEIEVALTQALEGQHALRVLLPAAEATGGFIRTQEPFPVADNHFFGRAWLRVGPDVPETHSYLISATGKLGSATAAYRLDSNGGKLNSRYTHASIEEHGGLKKFGYDMPKAEWLCVEWEYDGSNNEMRYWMNEVAVPGMTVTSAEDPPWLAPPEFKQLEIGWHTYQEPASASEFEILIDAIVLDDQRIYCGE